MGSESKDVVISPMYATSVGLVLKGFEHTEYINTSPEPDSSGNEGGLETDTGGILDKIKEWFTEENID